MAAMENFRAFWAPGLSDLIFVKLGFCRRFRMLMFAFSQNGLENSLGLRFFVIIAVLLIRQCLKLVSCGEHRLFRFELLAVSMR